ncbi:MAG: DUF423 domain-containing protein [Balneolaceae bacterium]
MLNPKIIIVIATFLLALAVAAGAFGAHALKNTLSPERLETWQTAVQYHAWHALGLLLIALIGTQFQIVITWPASFILAGILIFSGSLYVLCLTGIGWLGAITPIGGIAFIAGWIILGVQMLKIISNP